MAITTENDDMTILQPGPKGLYWEQWRGMEVLLAGKSSTAPHGYAKQKPALTPSKSRTTAITAVCTAE